MSPRCASSIGCSSPAIIWCRCNTTPSSGSLTGIIWTIPKRHPYSVINGRPGGASRTKHDPEKWLPVFGPDHAQRNVRPQEIEMSEDNSITVDVVSDAVCPWCFIGQKRLDKAIAAVGDVEVHVRWRPFQL